MTAVKICGIARIDDAVYAARLGADYLGLNFWPQSKRVIEPHVARAVARAARIVHPEVKLVGVFVDAPAAEVIATARTYRLDVVQLHGDETPAVVAEVRAAGLETWKAIAVAGPADLDDLGRWAADAYLLDAPSPGRGGSGQPFDWTLAARAVAAGHRVILAGGLGPHNVANAIAVAAPFAVDVASGVETSPRDKDPIKVQKFIVAVRRNIAFLPRG